MKEDLVDEQREFYRVESEQYEAWLRQLVDPTNDDADAVDLRRARAEVAARLAARAPLGRVLELAAGTGFLTELLLPHADSLTLLDSSDVSLGLARQRLGDRGATAAFVTADVFTWEPCGRRFDTICFAAWLHHVPLERFDEFWGQVGDALADGGTVLFDFPTVSHAMAREEMPEEPLQLGYRAYRSEDGVSIRDLDGRRWHVVHVLWQPDELLERLRTIGWRAEVIGAGWFGDVFWVAANRP